MEALKGQKTQSNRFCKRAAPADHAGIDRHPSRGRKPARTEPGAELPKHGPGPLRKNDDNTSCVQNQSNMGCFTIPDVKGL